MDKRTLTALQESIEKWRQIERGEMPDIGILNCSLCMEFHSNHCYGCPVVHQTGRDCCERTPHEKWCTEQDKLGRQHVDCEYVADTPKLVELARAEREFLESLLPED